MSKKITIIGLGAGDLDQLTIGCYNALKSSSKLYLRTKDHPIVSELEKSNISYETFDESYKKNATFEEVYQDIVSKLMKSVTEHQHITYAVPGHPMVAEKTVQLLIEEENKQHVSLEVIGGQSFLDPMFNSLRIDPIEGFQLVDATDYNSETLSFTQHLIFCQAYDSFVTSDVKLGLLEHLPPEYEVTIVEAAGTKNEVVRVVPLKELDYDLEVNNLRSIYVPPVKDESLLTHQFAYLRQVIKTLRGPNGCPWDKKQTHETLKKYLLEETYEVFGAIDEGDDNHLVEELGDVLLQVMLHAQIGEDEGYFSINDIIQHISEKMVRRHPHVFGDVQVHDEEEVLKNWENIKAEEKGKTTEKSLLNGVESFLPPLLRAYQLQKLAAKVGFDWPDLEPVWDKIQEEVSESKEAIALNLNKSKIQAEVGDLLFAVVNLTRKLGIDPSIAIETTNKKFIDRFGFIELQAKNMGKELTKMGLEEMDALWEKAKTKL